MIISARKTIKIMNKIAAKMSKKQRFKVLLATGAYTKKGKLRKNYDLSRREDSED